MCMEYSRTRKKTLRIQMKKITTVVICACLLFWCSAVQAGMNTDGMQNMGMGIPMGGSEGPDVSLCPAGVNVVHSFLGAWQAGEYSAMYKLLDESSVKGYPFDQASFDFKMLEYKPYEISQIRKRGENYT